MRPKVLALALVVALSACGGGGGDGGAEATAAATKVHAVPENGFSVAVPSGWNAVKPGEVLSDEDLENFRSENPEIRAYIDAISGPDSPIKFLAFDPAGKEEFATNLNVVVLPLSAGVTFAAWAKAAAAEIDGLPTRSGPVEEDRVELPAGEALRLSYDQKFQVGDADKTVATLQYGLVGEGRAYILTFTTLPEQEASYDEAFRAAAGSFRITPGG